MNFIKNEEVHKPIIYELYKYLKINCRGYNNRQTSYEIMKNLNISGNETFRSYIQEIRQSDVLQKFIASESGSKGGYFVATNQEEIEMTLRHILLRAMEMLKTYSILRRKARLNNQRRLKLSKYEKDVYQSLIEN